MEIGHIDEGKNYLFEGTLRTYTGEKEVKAIMRLDSVIDETGRPAKEIDFIDPENGTVYLCLMGNNVEEVYENVSKSTGPFVISVATDFTRGFLVEELKRLEKIAKDNNIEFSYTLS